MNRRHNIIYKITNKINDKFYVGVHKTNYIDDGYMGSGKLISRAIKKYGKENFIKEILYDFDTYQKALDKESEIVDKLFLEQNNTYNLQVGGKWTYSRRHDDRAKQLLSEHMKSRWENNREGMMNIIQSTERCGKISKHLKEWIKNNPEKHKARMDKINHDPEKIRKMADTHRGMKRSDESKKRMSESKNEYIKKYGCEFIGKGMIYIHNPTTDERKRVKKDYIIPEGWIRGLGRQKKRKPKGVNMYIRNISTNKEKVIKKTDDIPVGWEKGRKFRKKQNV